MNRSTKAPETREMTLAEIRALPGLLGRIAATTVEATGSYGYTDSTTGQKVRIVRKD
jgi:hypothetical protein